MEASLSDEALHWGRTLSGIDNLPADSRLAYDRIRSWWSSPARLHEALLEDFPWPEALLTRRLWNSMRLFQAGADMLRPVLERLGPDTAGFEDSMREVAAAFGGQEERLGEWRRAFENLALLRIWVSTFEASSNYVLDAFPGIDPGLGEIHRTLLRDLDHPDRFLDASVRRDFDARFLEFKQRYVERYVGLHRAALDFGRRDAGVPPKLDSVALRNLELLASLPFADRICLQRIQVIGKLLKRHHCPYPVEEILNLSPRCYCRLHPVTSRRLLEAIAQMSTLVQEGLARICATLRKHSSLVLQALEDLNADQDVRKEVEGLLQDRLLPLQPRTAGILKGITQRHPEAFAAAPRR